MSQKIKITATLANSQKKQNTVNQKIEYQWHWSRVFAALVLVVTVLFLLTLYIFPADDQKQSAKAVVKQGAVVSSSTLNSAEKTEDIIALETEKVDSSQSVGVESTQEAASDTPADKPRIQQSHPDLTEATGDVIEQVAPIVSESSVVTDAPNTEPLTAETPEPETLSEPEQTEPLADIALGAKMDTQSVSRALLSRDIVAREPVDIIGERIARASFAKKLYFFTEVNGLKGKLVRHKWYFQDQLQADVELTVYAERYRTYSSKNIAALQLGMWRVELVAEGKTLASKQFIITDQ
ncbi:DUF2914 domain-containing protein [Pseudoalteromonas sp. SSM20]|uniref:DUF2914 domain-containing protein n=1 Tax=Pseudoalteromonas sp. SSM20 TaxID=3139394 RepID=UPI003BAACCDA